MPRTNVDDPFLAFGLMSFNDSLSSHTMRQKQPSFLPQYRFRDQNVDVEMKTNPEHPLTVQKRLGAEAWADGGCHRCSPMWSSFWSDCGDTAPV